MTPDMTDIAARPADRPSDSPRDVLALKPRPGPVRAVLGPTNTGKTHLAVERMLAHASGMIGLPLRLLAREIYDRVVEARGAGSAALITGEEKILPKAPAYFVCTVESMPADREVAFLAVDEIQLAADPERGHVFTDRILHARGREETMLLGADSMRPILRKILPDLRFESRPRFSNLSYVGAKKLSRLPRRTAIVAFSAADVYAHAELIRRHRGGAAVVMGALSPRTRNAQVALYQSGEVDYLVATDAIGMGLNMDVDHVAFAGLRKFDGRQTRALTAPEVAQIAGRAGRHMHDGSFGTTGSAPPLDPEVIERVEHHRFEAMRALEWRNRTLNFHSLPALIRSLEASPGLEGLRRAPEGEDIAALRALVKHEEIRAAASSPDAIRLLWEVCRVPDFRKTIADEHARLIGDMYLHFMDGQGARDVRVLPEDWIAAHLAQLDRTDGDIDALAARIAHVRTWSYVANRSGWLDDPEHWRGVARDLEDQLSNALHEALTQRFIDQRTSVLYRGLRDRGEMLAAIDDDGEVLVEGHYVGRLNGFRFVADPRAHGLESKAIRNAAQRALGQEIEGRGARLAETPDTNITLRDGLVLWWGGGPVGRLRKGDDILAPRIELYGGDLLSEAMRARVSDRLRAWLDGHIADILAPLAGLKTLDLDGAARGIVFQLVEALGTVERRRIASLARALTKSDRTALRGAGVRFGETAIFLPALLKPEPVRLKLALWGLFHDIGEPLTPPPPGHVSVPVETGRPRGSYAASGFRVTGPHAVRTDMLERLAAELRKRNAKGPFPLDPALMSLVGCSGEDFTVIVNYLGYWPQAETDAPSGGPPPEEAEDPATAPGPLFHYRPRRAAPKRPRRTRAKGAGEAPAGDVAAKPRRGPPRKADGPEAAVGGPGPNGKGGTKKTSSWKRGGRGPGVDPDSPFAKLADLKERLLGS